MKQAIKLSSKGLRWFRSGHLWIFRDDIASGADKSLDGEIVRVESSTGTFLAQAFYSHRSQISLRVISFDESTIDREYYKALILRACARRGEIFGPKSACRLVSSEGDLFPGLIVDHYAGHLVLQIMTPGVEKIKPILIDILRELFSPKSITLRCDLPVRELDGLPQVKEMLLGEPQRAVEVEEGTVRYLADLWEGHKTGAYLDQRVNRFASSEHASVGAYGHTPLRNYAKGIALDAFCYQGHFALHLAGKCEKVVAIDSSTPALERLKENCELNNISNIEPRKANVFDILGEMRGSDELFDLIILDPPPFAKSRKDQRSAQKGYREINRRAISLLKPGGTLITYSCSFNQSAESLLDALRLASNDARRMMRVIASQTQSPDHPVLLTVPETNYLKGFVLEAVD